MSAVMAAHVNQLSRHLNGLERCLTDRSRLTNEGNHRPIGGLTRVNVEQQHSFHAFDSRGDLLDDTLVAPLTEIRNTLYKLF